MKLLRFGEAGAEKPGIIDASGTIRDLSDVVPDLSGAVLSDAGLQAIATLTPALCPPCMPKSVLGRAWQTLASSSASA